MNTYKKSSSMTLKEKKDWQSQDKFKEYIIFELDLERKREILWVRGSR